MIMNFLNTKGIKMASVVQKLRQFYWRDGFCLLVELQQGRVWACSLRSRLVSIKLVWFSRVSTQCYCYCHYSPGVQYWPTESSMNFNKNKILMTETKSNKAIRKCYYEFQNYVTYYELSDVTLESEGEHNFKAHLICLVNSSTLWHYFSPKGNTHPSIDCFWYCILWNISTWL